MGGHGPKNFSLLAHAFLQHSIFTPSCPCYTDSKMVEAFNNYFTDIVKNLASQFPSPYQSDYSYITRVHPILFDMSNIHEALTKQLDKMKPDKAPGSNNLTPREIVMCKDELNHSLYSLCNNSRKSKQFPPEYKIGNYFCLSRKEGVLIVRTIDP